MLKEKSWENMSETERENYAAGQLVSLEWLQTDSGAAFIQNQHNTDLMRGWILRNGKNWNAESLEKAYQATKHQHLDREPEPEVVTEPEAAKPPTPEELYGPFVNLKKEQIVRMSGTQMKLCLKDPRFQAKVDSLQITRADLNGATA